MALNGTAPSLDRSDIFFQIIPLAPLFGERRYENEQTSLLLQKDTFPTQPSVTPEKRLFQEREALALFQFEF